MSEILDQAAELKKVINHGGQTEDLTKENVRQQEHVNDKSVGISGRKVEQSLQEMKIPESNTNSNTETTSSKVKFNILFFRTK